MKKWAAASIEELNINQTAHRWLGNDSDGGYIGDGIISGHSKWKSEDTTPDGDNNTTETPAGNTNTDIAS